MSDAVRWPLEPLWRYCELRWGADVNRGAKASSGAADASDEPFGATVLARMVGVSSSAVHRWKERGGLSPRAADRAAKELGEHPSAIWDEYATWNPANGSEAA